MFAPFVRRNSTTSLRPYPLAKWRAVERRPAVSATIYFDRECRSPWRTIFNFNSPISFTFCGVSNFLTRVNSPVLHASKSSRKSLEDILLVVALCNTIFYFFSFNDKSLLLLFCCRKKKWIIEKAINSRETFAKSTIIIVKTKIDKAHTSKQSLISGFLGNMETLEHFKLQKQSFGKIIMIKIFTCFEASCRAIYTLVKAVTPSAACFWLLTL